MLPKFNKNDAATLDQRQNSIDWVSNKILTITLMAKIFANGLSCGHCPPDMHTENDKKNYTIMDPIKASTRRALTLGALVFSHCPLRSLKVYGINNNINKSVGPNCPLKKSVKSIDAQCV